MYYLLLLIGLAILVFAGDLLVRGAVGLAERAGIPALIIGLTVVAFGTSAPEMVVSVQAALADAPGIALGNVIGSNIVNILLVLGLPALIASTSCSQPLVLRNTLLMIGATVLFIGMCFTGTVLMWHGAVLFAMIIGFVALSVRRARTMRIDPGSLVEMDASPRSVPLSGLLIATGLIGLPIGAYFAVEAARAIALSWGISESAIGLTVVALGTSLPELFTNLMAALRRESAIAVGNVIGSNIFNILAVMGVTALVVPVPVPAQMLRFDLWVMLGCAILILPYVLSRKPIGKLSGGTFILLYGAYVVAVMSLGRGGA